MDMSVFAGKDRWFPGEDMVGEHGAPLFLIVLFITKQYTFRFISAARGVALVDVSVVAQADDHMERCVSKE